MRGQVHGDHEKPFLEHLEDLRSMITRMLVTLIVSAVACFAFSNQLMELLLRPVDRVWEQRMVERLPAQGEAPRSVDSGTWGRAQKLDRDTSSLDALQREALYEVHPDRELVFHARCVALLRGVLALPEEKRVEYLEGLGLPEPMLRQVMSLAERDPGGGVLQQESMRRMSSLRPTETFMLTMKLALFAGIVLSFPLLLLFLLQFVLPGMHRHERKVLWPAMLIGFGLFIGGVLFSYFVVLPGALKFFYEYGEKLGIVNEWRIGEYLSFATQFTLLFGVAFELPVVVMVLVKLGLLGFEMMSRTRSYAIVAIFILAAVLTPTPDPFTMLAMALPMILLYEACIWLAWFDRRKARLDEEREAREAEERRLARVSPALAGVLSAGSANEDPPAEPHAGDGGDEADGSGSAEPVPSAEHAEETQPAEEVEDPHPADEMDDAHSADDGWHVDMPTPEIEDTLGGIPVDFPGDEDGGGSAADEGISSVSADAEPVVSKSRSDEERFGAWQVEPVEDEPVDEEPGIVDGGSFPESGPVRDGEPDAVEVRGPEAPSAVPPAKKRGGRRKPRLETGELPLFGGEDGGNAEGGGDGKGAGS